MHRFSVMTQHLLALRDHSADFLLSLIRRAMALKAERREGQRNTSLAGRVVCLLFEKPSTRTRVSFETAVYGLGGQVTFMSSRETQLRRGEPLKDMARVMSRYVDALVVRTYGQEVVEELARYSDVPVLNALTDLYHPCQVLSDLMTVLERKNSLENLRIVWLGDGNNMANSWIEAAAVIGFPLVLCCPVGYDPDEDILREARARARHPITIERDPYLAVRGAEVINVDVWASMGQEEEQRQREQIFQPFRLDAALLGQAADDVLVLHCLPAHRGEEITDEVLEGPHSVVFDQAENKMHLHKALLEAFVGGGR